MLSPQYVVVLRQNEVNGHCSIVLYNLARLGGVTLAVDESGVEEIIYYIGKNVISFTQAPEQ